MSPSGIQSRSRVSPPNRWWDYAVLVLGALIVLMCFGYTIHEWTILPKNIPTHFSASGKPDQWGGKVNIIPLPILSLLFFAGSVILSRIPWMFNYPVQLTPHNTAKLYGYGRLFMSIGGVEIASVLFSLQLGLIRNSLGLQRGLGSLSLAIIIGISILTFIVFLVAIFSGSKNTSINLLK
ncbi:MAG: DUF1648 domain-containing protein [Bacilli bacterium]